MIYLLIDYKRDYAAVKIGYTANILTRFMQYDCHNSDVICVDTMQTYRKTKHSLELAVNAEMARRGYARMRGQLTGKVTEWYKIDYTDAFLSQLETQGLQVFAACNGRKSNGYSGY